MARDPGPRPQAERLGLSKAARLMRVLVFGETGQVARELARRAPGRGVALEALGRGRADLADPAACAARRSPATRRRRRDQRRRLHRRRPGRERARRSPRRSTRDAPGAMARAAAAQGPALPARLHRLRLRRHARPALARGRPHRPARRLRRDQARGRGGGGRGRRPPTSILRTSWVFSRPWREFREDHAPPRRASATELRVVDDQHRRPDPGRATSPTRCSTIAGGLRRRPRDARASSTSPAPRPSAGPTSPRRSSPRAADRAPPVDRIPPRDYPTPARRPLEFASSTAPGSPPPSASPSPTGAPASTRRPRRSSHDRRHERPQGHHPRRRLRHPAATRSPIRSRSSCCRSTTSR